MRYMSIFFTILLVWVAIILIAITRKDSNEIFQLYVVVMVSTVLLFLIGFGRR